MNIAFSSLLLFIMLLPGVVFRKGYFSEEFSKQYYRSNFFLLFASSLLPALIFQFIGVGFASFTLRPVDFEILGDLISRSPDTSSYGNLKDNTWWIFLYNAVLIGAAYPLGVGSKMLVRHYRLDRRFKAFRYSNAWHYIFSGEFSQFPRSNTIFEGELPVELVQVSILADAKDCSLLYEGILVDYELTTDGSLGLITVENVLKYRMNKEDLEGKVKPMKREEAVPIELSMMVFKYEEIKNIALVYYYMLYDPRENEFIILPFIDQPTYQPSST